VFLKSTASRIEVLEKTVQVQQKELMWLRERVRHDNVAVEDVEISDETSTWPQSDQEIECQLTIAGHTAGVTSVSYMPGGIGHAHGVLCSGSHDGSIKLFCTENGMLLGALQAHRMSIWALALDKHQPRLFSGGNDKLIHAWSWQQSEGDEMAVPTYMSTMDEHTGKIYGLVTVGDRLCSASSDTTIKVWDTDNVVDDETTIVSLATLTGHTDSVNGIVAMGDRLLSGSADGTVRARRVLVV
jgi:WD40 repeat protein